MAENEDIERDEEFADDGEGQQLENVIQVAGMYNDYFLDYASYVILERAVPHLHDGLKPVQRRILHSLKELDDGRFHKVANVIGNTMKYHPHGDASIGDAMVQIGQKELLLDCQGNWGNVLTGDSAAAPRYIEVKLSKFGGKVVFNAKTTTWLSSYDGRNKEPDTLPVKFPLLLASGVEGIAVGLACKMLPHNFVELIDGSMDVLRGKKPTIYPDFITGGMVDVENYNDGLRGGKIKVRARIRKEDAKTLIVHELPFGSTTTSLIESILKANDRGKIKVKKVEDNTADVVEIMIHLATGVSPDKTIDALYAFTDCEISISPNSCVIENDRPQFLGVSEMLRISTGRTKDLLQMELEIRKGELQESWHFASLEKIFIENRIYRDIEECETWEAIIEAIHAGLKQHIKHLIRKVTDEDVARLTEIKIKRISRFDSFKADEKIRGLEEEIDKVQFNLDNLVDFAIDYFKVLKKEFAEGRERKTEIKTFDTIDRTKVAVANAKLYVQKDEGFIGTGLKRGEGEFVCDCSDIDDVIVFRKDGTMIVTKVSGKAFVGKNIIHVWVWKKGDKRRVYNAIYRDGKLGKTYVKRFSVTSITRDKEYAITKGSPGSEVLYFTANPNGEAEVVTIILKQQQRVKKLKFDFDFSEQAIKGRGAAGNTLSKYPVRKVELKEAGVSTLGARKIWFDETVSRLNAEERGRFLGAFQPQDKILVLLDSGVYKLIGFDLSNRFEENMIHIEKWVPKKPVSVVYYDGGKEDFFVKRFLVEPSKGKVSFISESENSKLWVASTLHHPYASIKFNKRFKHTRDKEDQLVNLRDFIAVKGLKAQGNKLSALPITEVHLAPANEELETIAEEQLVGKPKEEPKELAESPVESGSETTTGTPDEVSPTIDLELPSSSPSDNKKDDTSDENPLTLF
ncbi:MAG: DNA gyrase/topoisomerase IV subunit A [Flavobacteriales bacterium]|nr:DNA gyrase/topoisomerase IV subunit A [Flavobacteriales bacterium]